MHRGHVVAPVEGVCSRVCSLLAGLYGQLCVLLRQHHGSPVLASLHSSDLQGQAAGLVSSYVGVGAPLKTIASRVPLLAYCILSAYEEPVSLKKVYSSCPPSRRDCTLANQEALKVPFSQQQQAQLDSAARLGKLFLVNKCTPSIWEHLISLVESEGSLAGMLEATTVPLCHSGYCVPPLSRAGPDLQFLNLTPAAAAALCQQYIAAIDSANKALYSQLPPTPAKPLILHGVVDLLCMDVDAVRAAFSAAPGAQLRQSMASAAASLVSVLSSAASVAAAGARGDEAGAARAAGQAAAAAMQAVRDAGLFQQLHVAGHGRIALAGQKAAAEGEQGQAGGAGQGGAAATAEEQEGAAAAEEDGVPEGNVEPMDLGGVARDMASRAAELAGPASVSPVLPAGAGALLLLPRQKRWEGKGRDLEGVFTHQEQQYSRYCIAQFTKPILVSSGQLQQASFRIAAECLFSGEALIGSWSKQAYNLSVVPQATLLLPTQPRHVVKRRLRAGQDAAKPHSLLYGNAFSQAAIDTALGESLLPLGLHIGLAGAAHFIWLICHKKNGVFALHHWPLNHPLGSLFSVAHTAWAMKAI